MKPLMSNEIQEKIKAPLNVVSSKEEATAKKSEAAKITVAHQLRP